MTITTSTSKTVLIANGIITSFAFTFKVFAADDIAVYVDNNLVSPSEYSVAGLSNDSGGSIDFTIAPINGGVVAIIRSMELTQEADYVPFDSFPAETHEQQLDRQVMMIQQISEQTDRAITVPVGEAGGFELPSVNDRSNRVLAFDELGAPIAGARSVDIESVADNESNINAVAGNIASLIAVANNQASINAVESNEENINYVADNLELIQLLTGSLSSTLLSLDLTVDGNPSVVGASYPNITEALAYADTVLQYGAKLTITIPPSSTINEPAPIVIDGLRMQVVIQFPQLVTPSAATRPNVNLMSGRFQYGLEVNGGSLDLSTLNLFDSYSVGDTAGLVRISNCRRCSFLAVEISGGILNSSSVALTINNSRNVDILSSQISWETTPVSIFDSRDVRFNNTNIAMIAPFANSGSARPIVKLSSSDLSITNAWTISGDNFGHTSIGIEAIEQSRVNTSGGSVSGATTALMADDNSTILFKSTITGETTRADPPENTYGNYQSRIITQEE